MRLSNSFRETHLQSCEQQQGYSGRAIHRGICLNQSLASKIKNSLLLLSGFGLGSASLSAKIGTVLSLPSTNATSTADMFLRSTFWSFQNTWSVTNLDIYAWSKSQIDIFAKDIAQLSIANLWPITVKLRGNSTLPGPNDSTWDFISNQDYVIEHTFFRAVLLNSKLWSQNRLLNFY